MTNWTLLTNHGHVMVYLASNPEARLRDLATVVGITERAAQRIVNDLVEDGYLLKEKVGRRNRYRLNRNAPMRHPIEKDHSVGELLSSLGGSPDPLVGRPNREG
jgi:predicted ArsR family transcriptional regulator